MAQFLAHEICGRCAPCRLGTKQIYNLLDKINAGEETFADVRKIAKLGQTISKSYVWGMGMTPFSLCCITLSTLSD